MSLNSIKTQLFINNEFVDSKSGESFDTIDPSNEEVLATVQRASKDDVDLAVTAATNAFTTWRNVSGPERRDLLLKLASLIEENQQFLAEWESKDGGKSVTLARNIDIDLSIKNLRYFAGWADKIQGKTVPTENVNTMAMTIHEPVGVVGCIIPWNFPILIMIWKLAPLLSCGCTAVLKSSEKTPITALLIAQLIKEAGFPAGVVNILSGYGLDCGSAIALHPNINKITFTGSSAVGRKIVKASGEGNLKKVTLELGGKSALIICDDADLDQAADIAQRGLFFHSGQMCNAYSRTFVDAKIYDAFVQKCIERAEKQKLGNSTGLDQEPIIDKIQYDRVMNFIESGKQEGAKCETGGKRFGEKGYFIEPTIFSNVTDDMKIAKEEIFGPVMQLMKVCPLKLKSSC
jgi:acyl-CoA reductase-like NAD-dependent aldehyde dehydrogenase